MGEGINFIWQREFNITSHAENWRLVISTIGDVLLRALPEKISCARFWDPSHGVRDDIACTFRVLVIPTERSDEGSLNPRIMRFLTQGWLWPLRASIFDSEWQNTLNFSINSYIELTLFTVNLVVILNSRDILLQLHQFVKIGVDVAVVVEVP